MALSWAIAGGGTGGHVTMALALGEVIRERGEPVIFIGSESGLENRLVPEAGFDLVALPSRQVMGQSLLGRVRGVLRILGQLGHARSALARAHADVVISVGGFAAMPAALAAVLSRRPLLLVEPNAIPGRVNRLTARFAKRVFVGFDAAAKWLGGPGPRVRTLGIPLRSGLVAAFARAPARRPPTQPVHLLVFGGSQGARQLNEAMMELAPRLAGQPLEIFHQTGEADRERVEAAYRKAGVAAQVVAFEGDMPSRYRWADVALCRAGALTVAELALAALPALLVPYPYAADDHQGANAAALEDAGAGLRIASRPLDVDALGDRLLALAADPSPLAEMSRAAGGLGRPTAAHDIVAECAALLGEGEAPA
jgi:UDP-N-acetylglucosamine--N-acetylmuramyl-(pentapeptide) pyrophosphoryl-undecaprenol N-acetylglucosamine transferase